MDLCLLRKPRQQSSGNDKDSPIEAQFNWIRWFRGWLVKRMESIHEPLEQSQIPRSSSSGLV